MPNILMLGCDKGLVDKLRQDDRWRVAIGVHNDIVETDAPSPLRWNLILDDCRNADQNHCLITPEEADKCGVQWYRVNQGYLAEAVRAHGISFRTIGDSPPRHAPSGTQCLLAGELKLRIDPPQGYRSLEFSPADIRAEHLADFLDKFGTHFRASRITEMPGCALFSLCTDAYDDPVVAIAKQGGLDWLLLPNIHEQDRRLDAFTYLCYRTAPKLWPDVYSDSFHPKKVQALEKELSRMVADRRSKELEVEGQIDSERGFYALYANLTVTGDDALKDLVGKVFQDVFGCGVKDLDDQIEQGERKTLDLWVESDDWSAMLEVKSSGNRNARIEEVERLDDNYVKAAQRHRESASKILVFNGMYWRDAEERRRTPTFGLDVIDEAKLRGIGLVTTQQLLEAIEAHRNEEITREQFVQTLAQPGLFHEPWK